MAPELKRQRGVILQRMTRIEVFIRDIDSKPEITAGYVQARLDVVDQCWVEFNTVQTAIDAEEGINSEEEEEKRATFEERCMNARAALRSIIERMQGPGRSAANANSGQPLVPIHHQQCPVLQQPIAVRLPTLELPSFSGDYMSWPAFRDAFEALIDKNTQLSNVQKLLYLKSTLKGEAASVLDAMDITDPNYRVAWDLLVEKFENRRIIKQKHLKALFSIKQMPEDSPKELRRLLTECQRNVNVLKQLGEPTDQWSTILVYLIASKLDRTSRRDWESQIQDEESPTYEEIVKFINGRCHTLEALAVDKEEYRKSSRPRPQLSHASMSSVGCKTCESSQNHTLWNCKKFIAMNPEARLNEVRKLKLCYNCFSSKHGASKCESRGCKSCSEKHNTLLHGSSQQHQLRQQEQSSFSQVSSLSEFSNPDQCIVNAGMVSQAGHAMQPSSDILATALVCIYDRDGSKLPCRVLLDSGSQPNFITQAFARKLRLKESDTSITVHGISGAGTQVGRQVTAIIESRVNGKQFDVPLLVMNKITNVLPSENFQRDGLPTGNKGLADPTFNRPGKIDVLLGAKLFFKLLLPEKVEIGELILWNSELGWIVSGSCKQYSRTDVQSNLVTSITDADLLQQVEKFWKVEELQSEGNSEDKLDPAERHYVEHVKRLPDGRYEVKLPLAQPPTMLGDSKEQALRRFYALEHRLQGNDQLREMYTDFMKEYESTGHMSVVAGGMDEANMSVNYLPHHAVLKPTSTTTKLRTVFDASSKPSSGLAVNDIMMTGPNIQADQFSFLLAFRCWRYVVTADVAKVYRQVRVDQQSSNLQRILWREKPSQPLKTYQLNTVTYGTRAAPFLAVRTLHQLAADEKDTYPDACRSICKKFYVDDLLDGSNSKQTLLKLRDELIEMLHKGGFELRKWSSNDPELLKYLPDSLVEKGTMCEIDDGEIIKSLGLSWDTRNDQLTYRIHLKQFQVYSRRAILSAIASLYDPVGLIAPVVVAAKILMQQLWLLNVTWDDPLPEDIVEKWQLFYDNLRFLLDLRIDRWTFGCQQPITVEIHGFSDASMLAYGARIYIMTVDISGNASTRLLCAKSRVAPLKKVTLPRLELCAAVLLSELLTKLLASVEFDADSCYLWTDSTITLQWITAPSNRWKEFVANRVEKVQNATVGCSWRYISGKDNPADIVSRGLPAEELLNSTLWWNGPAWLVNRSLWPDQPELRNEDVPEARKKRTKWKTSSTDTHSDC